MKCTPDSTNPVVSLTVSTGLLAYVFGQRVGQPLRLAAGEIQHVAAPPCPSPDFKRRTRSVGAPLELWRTVAILVSSWAVSLLPCRHSTKGPPAGSASSGHSMNRVNCSMSSALRRATCVRKGKALALLRGGAIPGSGPLPQTSTRRSAAKVAGPTALGGARPPTDRVCGCVPVHHGVTARASASQHEVQLKDDGPGRQRVVDARESRGRTDRVEEVLADHGEGDLQPSNRARAETLWS